jgi:hypothetical protein
VIFRREEGKACIRYAHAAFAFPAKPVTHVSEHLSPMCPVSTLAACPTEPDAVGERDGIDCRRRTGNLLGVRQNHTLTYVDGTLTQVSGGSILTRGFT